MKNMPSIETQHEMVRFFMKSIIPRIIEQRRKEEQLEEQNQDTSEPTSEDNKLI